ncbi:MAG TPA: tRNA adenosine(34) deaminase TadA [Vicinamibacterales bacterium]|nr:tRNA adenosine(34) deaminase TadA [Vicinamibacterales bacterium]
MDVPFFTIRASAHVGPGRLTSSVGPVGAGFPACYDYFLSSGGRADEDLMRAALELGKEARRLDEVPVGAVVVLDGVVIGEGFNRPIGSNDPTAHAEIVALRKAAQRIGNYRLTGATLYVTIEPCQMCVGAMIHARIARVVYGTTEPKAGAIESAMRAHEHPSLNHRMEATGGVLEAECREAIQEFFRSRRQTEDRS